MLFLSCLCHLFIVLPVSLLAHSAFSLTLHTLKKKKKKKLGRPVFQVTGSGHTQCRCCFFFLDMFPWRIRLSDPLHLWSHVIWRNEAQTSHVSSSLIISLVFRSDGTWPTLVRRPFHSTSRPLGLSGVSSWFWLFRSHSSEAELMSSGILTLCLQLIDCRVSFDLGWSGDWCWAFHFHCINGACEHMVWSEVWLKGRNQVCPYWAKAGWHHGWVA